MTKRNSLLITIDGGATGSRFAAFDASGVRVSEVQLSQPASLTLGVHQAWKTILKGIEELGTQLQMPSTWFPSALSMGLAGTLQEQRREEFLSLIPNTVSVSLITDGKAQLIGATGSQPGVCLAVGTGSVVHWQNHNGNTGMAGGWGFPTGDQGSGAWLGMRALQQYFWSRDGDQTSSTMWPDIEAVVGTSVSAIQHWSTTARATEFAQLAPLIFLAAERRDSVAQSLIHEAASFCSQLVALAPSDLPLVIVGSIGERLAPVLAPQYIDRMQVAKGDALYGLWLVASGEAQ